MNITHPTAIAETWADIERSLAEVYGDEFTRPLQVFARAIFYMGAGTLLDMLSDVAQSTSDVGTLLTQLDMMRDEVTTHIAQQFSGAH